MRQVDQRRFRLRLRLRHVSCRGTAAPAHAAASRSSSTRAAAASWSARSSRRPSTACRRCPYCRRPWRRRRRCATCDATRLGLQLRWRPAASGLHRLALYRLCCPACCRRRSCRRVGGIRRACCCLPVHLLQLAHLLLRAQCHSLAAALCPCSFQRGSLHRAGVAADPAAATTATAIANACAGGSD
jgi:hypothetical protein